MAPTRMDRLWKEVNLRMGLSQRSSWKIGREKKVHTSVRNY